MNLKLSVLRVKSPNQKLTASLMLMCLFVFVAGCATSPPAGGVAPEPDAMETPAPGEAVESVPEDAEAGRPLRFEAIGIAFLEVPEQATENQAAQSGKFIEAQGFGLPSPSAENDAQKRLTAMEAAQYRALANLAEKVLGQEVVREARVVDMAYAGEEVRVNLSGKLKGVSEVVRSYDAETEIATVSLKVAVEPEEDSRRMTHEQSLSIDQRKARAVAAARIHATALLREQIGQVYVEQDIRVENLEMAHQEARIYVKGLLDGIIFSDARWPSETQCEVTATLEVDKPCLNPNKGGRMVERF